MCSWMKVFFFLLRLFSRGPVASASMSRVFIHYEAEPAFTLKLVLGQSQLSTVGDVVEVGVSSFFRISVSWNFSPILTPFGY